MKISVAGTGYVGLSNAIILAQNNKVYAVDVVASKVDLINSKKSPVLDKEIEEYLATKSLDLTATLDGEKAYKESELVIIATPTNFDSKTNMFDTSSGESVIEQVKRVNPNAWIIVKSTVGVGFTKHIREKYHYDKILFSPEFLREGKALYDNLYPSRIVVGVPEKKEPCLSKAKEFAELLREGAIKKDIPVHILGCTEAEAVKLFANTYLALRVAYFNELDTFAQTKGLDTLDIIKGVCGICFTRIKSINPSRHLSIISWNSSLLSVDVPDSVSANVPTSSHVSMCSPCIILLYLPIVLLFLMGVRLYKNIQTCSVLSY